jgi:hypothetical protein
VASTSNEKRRVCFSMPFLRSRHDGTLALSAFNSPRRPRFLSLRLALKRSLALSPKRPANLLLFAAPAAVFGAVCVKAAPSATQGVRAWTSGNPTSIRSRPAKSMPVVAKVNRHMPLFVWGKFNGWYRVETHDHIFGWVEHPYLSGADLDRVREMSAAKAQAASERTSDQIMFGTREALQEHYQRFGSLGALKGLKQHGVSVVLKAPPKVARQTVAPVTRPVVAVKRPIAPSVQVSSGPAVTTPSTSAPRVVETVPDNVAASLANESGPSRLSTLHAGMLAKLPELDAPRELLSISPPPAVKIAPIKAPVVRAAAKPKPAVARKPRESWRTRRYKARLAARQKQREQLRNRVGLTPKGTPVQRAQPNLLAPVSPEELMRARDSFLQTRKRWAETPWLRFKAWRRFPTRGSLLPRPH